MSELTGRTPQEADRFISRTPVANRPAEGQLLVSSIVPIPAIKIEIPKPRVEVIAETRIKRVEGERFERIESDVSGIKLVVEHGTRPRLGKRRTRRLKAHADRVARWRKYERLAKLPNGPRDQLIEVARESGFRGIISEKGNHETKVFPTERNVRWNADLLEDSTGSLHEEFVRDSARVVIDLPIAAGEDAGERALDFSMKVARLLVDEGNNPEEVGTLITPVIVRRLDEEYLNQRIAEGSIQLLPGTRTSEVIWETPSRPLSKNINPQRQRPISE